MSELKSKTAQETEDEAIIAELDFFMDYDVIEDDEKLKEAEEDRSEEKVQEK